MEVKYFKSMASDGITVIAVYKNVEDYTSAIYMDGTAHLGLMINELITSGKYQPAKKEEFEEFIKMAIKKLQSL